MTTTTVNRCIKEYNENMWLCCEQDQANQPLNMQLQGCAACGIGDFNVHSMDGTITFKRVSLTSLSCSQITLEQYDAWKADLLRAYRTVHVVDDISAYFLHSEFVTYASSANVRLTKQKHKKYSTIVSGKWFRLG